MKKSVVYSLSAVAVLALLAYKPVSDNFREQARIREELVRQLQTKELALKEIEEESRNYFYYNQLTAEEQEGYLEFASGLREFATEFHLADFDSDQLARIYIAVMNDFPEFYWLSEERAEVDFSAYRYPDQVKETSASLQAIIDQVVAQVPEGSDYDKVKFIYEYVIQNTAYNTSALTDESLLGQNQSIRSVFLDKSSVCAGYSRAFQLLCQKVGVESIFVAGDIVAYEEPHAWNLVKLDGQYYAVDTTWGDPVFESAVVTDGITASEINYAYLGMPAILFNKTHTPWETFKVLEGEAPLDYPQIAGEQFNYYSLQGAYFEQYDKSHVQAYLTEQIVGGAKTEVSMQFATPEAYQAMVAELQSENSFVHDHFSHQESYQGYDFIFDEHSQVITIRAIL